MTKPLESRSRLDDVLDEIEEFLENQQDVVDGSYGEPRPNKAMNLLMELQTVRGTRPKSLCAPSETATSEAARFRAMEAATKSHVDGRDLLYELNPNGAHFINIRVRINGQWKEYEGDWLKRLMWARDGNNRGGRPPMPEAERAALMARLEAQSGASGDEQASSGCGSANRQGNEEKKHG